MRRDVNGEHPIRRFFAEALHDSMRVQMGLRHEDVEEYLCDLLMHFLHDDEIYGIRDASGQRVDNVVDMVVEGDVRLNADSFDREREVHKHIGDFLLFWSGVFPEFLKQIRAPHGKDALLDPIGQGRLSYYVASTFDYGDYAREAPVLRKLSGEFEAYMVGLSLMRAQFQGLQVKGWSEGFDA
jgi:hypothetical protein